MSTSRSRPSSCREPRLAFAVTLAITVIHGSADAGDFNYADVFPGDRAAGMGGAFTALSDDASGTYYNPAGLVHAGYASVSVSANAFAWRSETFRSAFFGEDLKYESSSFFPSAVASALKFDDLPGFAFGLSVVVPHSANFTSQQHFNPDLFEGIDTRIGSDIESSFNTYQLGPSAAFAVLPSLSVGVTLYGIYATSTARIGFTTQESLEEPGSSPLVTGFVFQSTEESSLGFTSVLGILWTPIEGLSVGLAIRPPGYQHHEGTSRATTLSLSNDGVLVPNPGFGEAVDVSYDEGPPASFTPGVAWRATERLTLSFDTSFHLRRGFSVSGVPVTRKATWNVNAGAELSVLDEVPIRIGFFTNRTSSPEPTAGDTRFLEHVSDYGFTVGTAYVVSYAEVSIGLRESWGNGKSVAFTDSSKVVDVDAAETVVIIGSRYKF